jgi:hypothetical protein
MQNQAWTKPQIAALPGERLHLQHGPIDLVIKAEGDGLSVRLAYAAAARRFETILPELTAELPLLRAPLAGASPPQAKSPVATRMIAACWPHRADFITPMAAVAGAVADAMLAAILQAAPDLGSAYVNNGGDIAAHVAAGRILRIGLVPDLTRAAPEGLVTLTSDSGVGGIATSGWRGRSFSLGIADAVTVLARSAAEADAAATMVANAVDCGHPAISRAPACSLDPDSDLGDLMVTTGVGPLSAAERADAMEAGLGRARGLLRSGLIVGALVALQGDIAVAPAAPERSPWQALPFGRR